MINTTYKVSRREVSLSVETNDSPSSLVYKKYGGNVLAEVLDDEVPVNSPLKQSIISYEMSKRHWGPRLFGVTDNTRIEEYIDCDTLTASQVFTSEISNDLARVFARFHSLDFPFNRERGYGQDWSKIFNRAKEDFNLWIESAASTANTVPDEVINSFKELFSFPFAQELAWLASTIAKIKHRTVFCNMDPNYLNRLVKKKTTLSAHEDRCMIIDFDISCYYHRGYDLGGLFVSRTFDLLAEDYSSGFPYPSQEERDAFLTRYLDESRHVFDDFDPVSPDNIENIRKEADVHAINCVFDILMESSNYFKLYSTCPKLHLSVDAMLKLFYTLKHDFQAKYP